ncbi:MAG: gliding motility-associated C-terminal domain-containing protein [Bacteroidota bacterium]
MQHFLRAGNQCRGYVFLILLSIRFLVAPNTAFGQCANDNNLTAIVNGFTCNADATVAAGAGTYVTFPVFTGAVYSFRTCGTYVASGNTFDTQLTGYDNSGGALAFYNDDANAFVSGTNATTAPCTDANSNFRDSYIGWTSTFTGTLRILVDRFSCNPCTSTNCPSAYGSALLTYRQTNNLSFTSSNANLCPGLSVNLSATPAGGTFSGTGGSVSGITFTAPSTAGIYTVTYTLGGCSVTQDIVVNSESVAPTSISGTTAICPGGNTTLTVQGGSLGTGAQWFWYSGSCGGTLVASGVSFINVSPGSNTTYYVRAQGTCNTTTCASTTVTLNPLSTDPISISGNATICTGGNTTLTVQGGSLGTGAQWFWYSGSCGGTFVASGTNSINVSPASPTTYYVRAQGTCNTTNCASVTVGINTQSLAPGSISATNTLICNGQSTTLTANGATLGTGGVLRWYSGSCGGTAEATGTSVVLSPAVTTTYFVRAEDPAPCSTLTSCASITITVNQPSVAPTTVTGNTVVCSGGSTTLTVADGFLGTGATWQWYSNSCGGTIVGSGTSIVVSPVSNTTYYVRAEGSSPCTTTTACASVLVTVSSFSSSPSSVAGTTTVCEGNSTTLSVVGGSLGTGADWQWYEGGCGTGPSIGSGNSIVVTPATATDYYVRAGGPCDTSSCAFATVSVNDSSLPASSIAGSPVICIGGSTNLTAVGGHLGVGATWNWYTTSCGGTLAGTGPLISVSPTVTTTYYLRAEGLCNTTTCTSFTVTVAPLPNGSIGGSAIICAGTVDTVLTFNFSIGTGPFDITYTDGTNSFSKTGVNSGDTAHVLLNTNISFSFSQIQDANGCVRNSGFTGGATISFVPLPVITFVAPTDVLCNGDSTGTIAITGSTGTAPYTYSIDGGSTFQTNNPITGLPVGSYNLAIADVNNCSSLYASNPVVIDEPLILDHTNVIDNASCASVFDGKITITATGGVSPYGYSLNGGPSQSGNVFTGLTAGIYIVQVADVNGCTDTSYVLIDTVYAVSGVIVSQTDVSCFGGIDGTVTVQLTGGIPPYSYSINGFIFQASPTFTGLASGNYVATLRDSKGCTDYLAITIAQPSLLQALVDSIQEIACTPGGTGGIFISVTGGNGGNSFLWSNADTTEDITGLSAGIYTVAITDSKGCTASVGASLSEPVPLFLSIASYQDLLCFNDSSGEIDITVNGGIPQYTFVWSTGATNEDISSLASGTYSVTITDANGCVDSLSQFIDEPSPLTSTIVPTGIPCSGGAGGNADLTVSGGIGGYSYLWNNGTTTEDLFNVSGGNYSVVIYDANGCSMTDMTTIAQPVAISLSTSVTNVLCLDSLNGAIDLAVSGGAGGYTYLWSNNEVTEDISNLGAGSYSVVVTDANLCTASASAIVTQPVGLVLNSTVTNAGCAGGNNGSIDVTIQGGVFPYSYSWNNLETTEDINGLSPGNYSVVVTDANGCTLTESFTITGSTPVVSFVVGTNVTCSGLANGTADLTVVSGGTSPYTYLWNTFQNTEDISSLSGGTYYVIIKDANGCESRDSVIISEPLAMTLSTVVTNVLCFNSLTGFIDLSVSNGAGGYTYLWSNNEVTEDISNLAAGNYSVVVTDANLCTASVSATVTQPTPLLVTASVIDVQCGGNNDGSVSLSVFGGTPAYTFLWSNNATTQNVQNLSAGPISVTVTDANGCSTSGTYVIAGASGAITSTITGTNVLCNGSNTGSATVVANGGSLPYTYLWSNFQATSTINGLDGGTYYVIITDANGCTRRDSVIITEPSPFIISVASANISCFNANDGAIDLTVSGASQPYTYLWSNNDTTQDITGLSGGTYSVVITDLSNCTATATGTIINPSSIGINFVAHNPLCYQDLNGSVDLIPSGGTPNYSFSWSNTANTEDISAIGAGVYIVTVTDANSCFKIDSVTVTEPTAFYVSGVVKPVTCNGYADGEIDATAYGGTLPYSFNWMPGGQSTEDLWNLSGGSDTIFVFDANGCAAVSIYVVTEPQPLTVYVVATNIACFGASNGTVAAIPTGGTQPYNYLWSNFSIDSLNTGLSSNLYSVILTDFNGCLTYDSITVTQPTDITISAQVTDATCNGANTGAINITVAGGTPSYSFVWTGAVVTEDLTGLAAGTYSVTVTDANSCIKTDAFVVEESVGLFTSVSSVHPICNGGNTGYVVVDASGGNPPYTYAWNTANPNFGPSAGNLNAGSYSVTVSDAGNCSASISTVLMNPDPIEVTTTALGANCFNTTGIVTATVTGGTQPYSYLLNGAAQANGTFANVPPGDYLILVMDVNGCQGNTSFTVSTPGQFTVNLGASQQAIITGMETQLVATVDSGVSVLHYYWSPDTVFGFNTCTDCYNPMVAPFSTTIFTVTVMSADSCYASDTITIYVENELARFIPTAFTPNGDGLNDRFEFDILGATKIETEIYNRWGERVFYNQDQKNGTGGGSGWDGTKDGKPVPYDTYVYQINATYLNDDEIKKIAGTVTLMK